jgi:hypothetical protein
MGAFCSEIRAHAGVRHPIFFISSVLAPPQTAAAVFPLRGR